MGWGIFLAVQLDGLGHIYSSVAGWAGHIFSSAVGWAGAYLQQCSWMRWGIFTAVQVDGLGIFLAV
jgi:hypothetical protein